MERDEPPLDGIALLHERRLALDLRGETRDALVERRESLHLGAHDRMSRRIVADRNRREVALHRRVPLLLCGHIAYELLELLNRLLDLRELPLERAHLGRESATPLVELLYQRRHLLQL